MNASQLAPSPRDLIMQSHRERYKGWGVVIEISGDCQGENCATGMTEYVPRIVVTEQLSIGFRELEVSTDCVYLTPTQCFQGGISLARKFIDNRM